LKKDRPRILIAYWTIPENNMGGGLLLPETERVAARVIVLPTGQTVEVGRSRAFAKLFAM
jgi:hypothetical protein